MRGEGAFPTEVTSPWRLQVQTWGIHDTRDPRQERRPFRAPRSGITHPILPDGSPVPELDRYRMRFRPRKTHRHVPIGIFYAVSRTDRATNRVALSGSP